MFFCVALHYIFLQFVVAKRFPHQPNLKTKMHMHPRQTIVNVYKRGPAEGCIWVCGWVRTMRANRFLNINDGSCAKNLQVILDEAGLSDRDLRLLTAGTAVRIHGQVVPSAGKGQPIELRAKTVCIVGTCDPQHYPLQPKRHSMEFLRTIGHLRIRTNTFGAVFRVRSKLSFAVHQFFQQNGFVHVHTPILTASDAEGAGEMFRVTTIDPHHHPQGKAGGIDWSQDFFGKPAYLTVSAQLEGELMAMGLGNIYTFGPTFRAENSNTTRHLAEFWMIEPEMAFCDLQHSIYIAEKLLWHCISFALSSCEEDLSFLEQYEQEEHKYLPATDRQVVPLRERLARAIAQPLLVISYSEAIDILQSAVGQKAAKFHYPVKWGEDLQSEHERFLVDKHFQRPVAVIDYPKDLKAFYMRENEDGKTVAAVDILLAGIGEIIGGSQREERLDKLEQRIGERRLPVDQLQWYLDTRRFGNCPHAGFGLGFERLVQFVTGMRNIRDVIAFARTPQNIAF